MQPDDKNSNSWWGKITGGFNPKSIEVTEPSNIAIHVQASEPDIKNQNKNLEPPIKEKVEVESSSQQLLRAAYQTQIGNPTNIAVDKKKPAKNYTRLHRFNLRMARSDELHQQRQRNKTRELATRKKNNLFNQKKTRKKRIGLVREHIEGLRLKKMQCRNTWGRLETIEWNRIADEFLRTVLRVAEVDKPQWKKHINVRVGPANLKKSNPNKKAQGTSFEFEVAAQMRSLGWNVQFLGKSGDQGGDLLAQKLKNIVVIQCKNFAAKIGNSAVQEVVAAKQFYHANLAAVVGKNGFTRQAHQLAEKNSVLLLDISQLAIL